MTIKDLKPALVFSIFDQINQVPRPSKKEEKIRQYLLDFAAEHNIAVRTDAVGNVAMTVPATPGCENAPMVVMQSHMDMVCESNDKNFDFNTQPIRTIIDGEWLRADGTTLGADNGIGMAASLAALIDKDLVHGPLEALFTVDEETGLTGANNLGEGMFHTAEPRFRRRCRDIRGMRRRCGHHLHIQLQTLLRPHRFPFLPS